MTKSYHVAVVGATGAVGTQMIELLEEAATFKIKQVSFLFLFVLLEKNYPSAVKK